MSRTFGWIQDGSSFENLKKVLSAITPDSALNIRLKKELIPKYVPERYGRDALLKAIDGDNCNSISYGMLKGKGTSCQLTVQENMTLFAYSLSQAEALVAKGGRGNAACTGIAQLAISAQKTMPNGEKKPYQGDWPTDSFIRWGISLGFIDYNVDADVCSISALGRRFVNTANNSDEESVLLGEALISYPPACRVLKLLDEKGHLTKFEIGNRLGFIGEAGFTSLAQNLFVSGISTARSEEERRLLRANFEGSSDKYARMICGWLVKLGWVAKVPKSVTEHYLGASHTILINQSYMLTLKGKQKINSITGRSSKKRSEKIVLWNMLSTDAPDCDYLRNRRYYIIQSIKRRRSVADIQACLQLKGFNVNKSTILDDLNGLICIGLAISETTKGFLLEDSVIKLSLPIAAEAEQPGSSAVKDELREKLINIDHRYLVLVDLACDNKANKQFEIETLSLLTNELDYSGIHLGGAREPDGLIYKNNYGVIIDTKAYSEGFNLPLTQADEMVRYVNEMNSFVNKSEATNSNKWWKHFGDNGKDFSFLFVSSKFKGNFLNNLLDIKMRTGRNGGAITAENLLLFAEEIKSKRLAYADSFLKLRTNDEVKIN